MANQTIEFKFSGLDQDSDQRLMQPGDSRYRLNCINDSTDTGHLGDIQNVKGNVLHAHTAPAGTNITIGSVKDIKNNAIVYFVYNSNGDHQIRRYYPDSGVDELIIQSEVLNFQSTSKIYHANIVQDLLYWTDGWFEDYGYGTNNLLNYNPPRKINMTKAMAGDPGYAPLKFETLDRIKYQPAFPPTLKYGYNPSLQSNYIEGKLFQATTRFLFDDKEQSCWSSLSKVLLPAITWKIGPDQPPYYNPQWENNLIITVETGSEIVTDIEIALRSSIANSEDVFEYFIIARLNKEQLGIPSNTTYDYTYEGIALNEPLNQEEFLRPFDYVPQISKCQEYCENRIVDWNEVENYSSVDIDVDSEFIRYYKEYLIRETTTTDSINYGVPWSPLAFDLQFPIPTFKSDGVYQYGIVYYDRAGRAGTVNTKEDYIIVSPQYDVDMNPFGGMLMDPLKLRLSINNPPPIWARYYQIVLTKELSYVKKTMFGISAFNYDSLNKIIYLPDTLGYTFQEGDRIRFLAYNKPQAPDDILRYPLFDTAQNTLNTYHGGLPWSDLSGNEEDNLFSTSYINICDCQILSYDITQNTVTINESDNSSLLLNGIKGYRELYGASTNYFYIVEVYNKNRSETDNRIFFEIGQKYDIAEPYTTSAYHTGPVQNQILNTQPAIVDVFGFDSYLRWKKQTSPLQNFFSNQANAVLPYLTALIDGGTLPYTPPGTVWRVVDTSRGLYSNLDLTNCIPLLISTHAPIVSTVVTFTSLDSNEYGYQDFSTNPALNSYLLDFYGFTINGPAPLLAWVEDVAFSDDYPSVVYNDGRTNSNLETLGRKQYFARGRWSEQLFENTLINGLSTVYGGSYKDLSERYNEVSRIRQVGNTLRVRQKSKMTSFYLNKNMLNVNEGVPLVGQSSDFLSTPNLYDEEYGSSSPGADIDNGIRTNYLIDLLRGIVIRDAGNQPGIISGDSENPKDPFRMTTYFRNLFKQIRETGEENFNIIGAWDDYSQLYTLTIQNLSDSGPASQTIVFHEPTNRWKSFMSYIPEWYETLGKYLISFKDGQVYVHYENDLYNNFFGVQYGQELRVTANMGRNTIKVFNNMDLYSNIAWEVPTVSIPSSPNYPNGMLSKIPASRFVAKEGVFHAPFFRDQNDPRYANSVTLALTQGRRLRGETIELTMTNTSTDLVYVKALNIFVEPSELTI